MNRLSEKVAIVTGAALGIGRASAVMLAGEGARVVLTDVRDADGLKVVDTIQQTNGEALFIHHDVSDEPQWEDVVRRTFDRFGRLDVLVNNAGVADACSPEDETLGHWRQLMKINLEGVFLGTKHAIAAMKTSAARGSIINLSSIAGIIGVSDLSAYCASKGAVRLYTKAVALHCARCGLNIRVNSIHPGYIWTPMVENYLAQHGDVEDGRRAADALHPIGHIGEPDDIAYGVVYLASDESKFVTGSELVIDGGYTAQ
jgi:NAD(P)-dependent dehydrogenase (short-subunit alcohol dehydrogenase family)